MNLRSFQEELKELIFFRNPEPSKSRLWAGGLPERLSIYRNNTRTNWTDTLDHDFPLTRRQFSGDAWPDLRKRFFTKHPPEHWELNASIAPFVRYLKAQNVKPWVKELADYEWHDLKVFIDRTAAGSGAGLANPTAVIRAYQHQIFFWVQAVAPPKKPPVQKPEVLVFYRDSRNTVHIREADPLMILMLEHFHRPARLEDLEPVRRRMLPDNHVPLQAAFDALKKSELIL